MSQTFNTCFKLLTCFSIVYVTKSTWRPTKCCHRSRDSTSYLHYKLMILCKDIWDKVFTDGPTRICGAQPLKNFTWSILECFGPFISQTHSINYLSLSFLCLTLQYKKLFCIFMRALFYLLVQTSVKSY